MKDRDAPLSEIELADLKLTPVSVTVTEGYDARTRSVKQAVVSEARCERINRAIDALVVAQRREQTIRARMVAIKRFDPDGDQARVADGVLAILDAPAHVEPNESR